MSDGISSYLKNIKVRENNDNDVLIINTNFGYVSEIDDGGVDGQYNIEDVLKLHAERQSTQWRQSLKKAYCTLTRTVTENTI